MAMRIHIVTLFPEFFESPLRCGIAYRALQAGVASFRCVNPRDFTRDRHRTVDDAPYGGGPGMILKPEPMVEAIEHITGAGNPARMPVTLLSPQGPVFTQRRARELAQLPDLVLVCGRYKAMDERVRQLVITDELSVGDYVLSGGEPACLAVLDAVLRLLPGAIGDQESAETDSFEPAAEGGLDCAYYTRPPEYRGLSVPETLLSGNHAEIAAWRRNDARARTASRRPDLRRDDDGGAQG
jgi:tRNA (guanine37-N1)-methyltransferase